MNYKLLFFAYALNLFYYVPNLLASPIVGGEEDTFHTYKYHVSIQLFNPSRPNSAKLIAGGTIIHDRYVLSSAHPFLRINNGHAQIIQNPNNYHIVVVSGTSETYGPGLITRVDKIFIPREFTRLSPVYGDISVLKLVVNLNVERNRDSLQMLSIDPGFNSFTFYENKSAFILGNGYNTLAAGDDGVLRPVPRFANKRQRLEVLMTPKDSCPIFDYAICTVNLHTSHIGTCCIGDSGNPLVFGDTVIAVVSVGPKTFPITSPIYCTRTSTFYNFIQDAMNENVDHTQMYILYN